ncbi:MAG: hypothetical protein JST53_00375 [Actinobacteria bacterium]|nr:hypothetical protein [Actinomycetota bacterium]
MSDPFEALLRSPSTPRSQELIHQSDAGERPVGLLGLNGASLGRLHDLGLESPPSFTVTTESWRLYRDGGRRLNATLFEELEAGLDALRRKLEADRALPSTPLLVAVRPGPPVPMPGMLANMRNLGLDDDSVAELSAVVGSGYADALYRHMLVRYAIVIRGLDAEMVSQAVSGVPPAVGSDRVKTLIAECCELPFPSGLVTQLAETAVAVWRSWDEGEAKRYRRAAGIADDLGTAFVVQAMVPVAQPSEQRSGTGLVLTRDPSTGAPQRYGEYLQRDQDQAPVADFRRRPRLAPAMRAHVPAAYRDLQGALEKLEASYRDLCSVKFRVDSGRLWILGARPVASTAAATVRIAVDLIDEGLIDVDTGLSRIPISALVQLQAPVLARGHDCDVLGRGTVVIPGVGIGAAAFDTHTAMEFGRAGVPSVLIWPEVPVRPDPELAAAMVGARGIVIASGGLTSHVALVTKGIDRPSVRDVPGLRVDPKNSLAVFGELTIRSGDPIAVDGATGRILAGTPQVVPVQPDTRIARVLQWCEERHRLELGEDLSDRFQVAREPAEVDGDAVLIDVEWTGPESVGAIRRMVVAAAERQVDSLALRFPGDLVRGDIPPLGGPWKAIEAADNCWAAKLLAARLCASRQEGFQRPAFGGSR